MNPIAEKAMLVAVHISQWTARKHDRSVSREVASTHNSEEKLGRYNKRLLAGATKLDDIQTLAGKIRAYFYATTLPWSDEGLRILPATLFFDLTSKMKEFEQEFHIAVQDFIEEYPQYVESTRPQLNGLFCAEDYPAAEELRAKFGMSLEILPIPSSEDFRVQLSEEQKTIISQQIDENVRNSLAKSNRDLWFRTYEVISHFALRLRDPDARLHASIFAKVAEMAELLPKLNITDDPALNELARKVKIELCEFSVSTLRNHPSLRADTAAKAFCLANQMDATLKELADTPEGAASPAVGTISSPLLFLPMPSEAFIPPPAQSADAMFAHMAAYMGDAAAAA